MKKNGLLRHSWFALALLITGLANSNGATTYYVDSIGGKNSSSGIAPEAAWKDFFNINGRTLSAGERLLIKRGSVINQELRIGARGTPDQWAEIGAYGEGARPSIRRNWDINDRCVLVRNPDFLRISSLVVSHAGKGLIVCYAEPGHGGLVIEDCIAHHIEGLYRPDSSGIPEWRNFHPPTDDGLSSYPISPGIAVTGKGRDITLHDCEMFQTSRGFHVQGGKVALDRVYSHHNYTFNTSPHPQLVGVTNAVMQNCIFDASGYHAYAGTMGIMLIAPMNLTIRNCTFRNQPDSGCYDEGCIDFEANGNGCLVESCTFQNNAGAAIEFLGFHVPQVRNVEICRSRFIQNNWAKKLGPSEIFIWGKNSTPEISCSTGSIHDNGYVLLPGIEFFTNQAPKTTQWTVTNNTAYPSIKALDEAMPLNSPPVVSAGDDVISNDADVRLNGLASDDGRPANKKLAARWELLEGPGKVTFKTPAVAKCDAVFSAPGDYVLRLVGDDGELWTSSMVTVHILPRGVTVAKAWEFNTPLDKQGWTDAELGTQAVTLYKEPPVSKPGADVQIKKEPAPISCISYPVHYVAGGCYILALENAPTAHLLSADSLDVPLKQHKTVRLRLQNHTSATHMTLRFITSADPAWSEAKSVKFTVAANDNEMRDYAVDLSALPGWTGTLKQLRLDLTGGDAATGTCRIDYIRIDDSKPAAP